MEKTQRLHLPVVAGAGLALAAGLAFAAIAEDVVTSDPITQIDLHILAWFHAHASAGLTRAALLIARLQGPLAIGIAAALTAAWWHWRRDSDWALALLIAVPGGMLLNTLLKALFHRARPHFDDPLLTLGTYSFPSGHAAAATLFYGMWAAWLIAHVDDWSRRLAVAVLALMLSMIVGLSRVYLGVHYPTDVLGATAEAIAWLALSLTVMFGARNFRPFQAHRA